MSASRNRKLVVSSESWPLERPFVISRGSKTCAEVVVARIEQDGVVGLGEAVPYARYDESVESVVACARDWFPNQNRSQLLSQMAAGAARNALDCALWDLEAKLSGTSVRALMGIEDLQPVLTAFTLSLGSPVEMAAQAQSVTGLPLLKLKLGGTLEDAARMEAVRRARPDARLIADANEAWGVEDLAKLVRCAEGLAFEMIEQPLVAGQDGALSGLDSSVAICADESVHTTDDLGDLVGRYDAVNIKLDKTGGLSEAIKMASTARSLGFKIMLGSMVCTSLGVAPALMLASGADWVDLDGPLLLKEDRRHGLSIEDGWIAPPLRELWG